MFTQCAAADAFSCIVLGSSIISGNSPHLTSMLRAAMMVRLPCKAHLPRAADPRRDNSNNPNLDNVTKLIIKHMRRNAEFIALIAMNEEPACILRNACAIIEVGAIS